MAEKLSYFARDLIENGEDFVIAKVVDTRGSTPRKKGAVLLMKKDGTTVGTVGGGLLEAETEKLCRKTLETGRRAGYTASRLTKNRRALSIWDAGEMRMCRYST